MVQVALLALAFALTHPALPATRSDTVAEATDARILHSESGRCRTVQERYGREPAEPIEANGCSPISRRQQLAMIAGGRILQEPEVRIFAPWQAEIRSTYVYTAEDIEHDRNLATDDPEKFWLDQKQEWERQNRCGGVYIGDGWVLTAAHCATVKEAGKLKVMDNFLSARRVRLGARDLSQPGPDFAVEAAVIHKGYLRDQTRDDIALLKLDLRQPDGALGIAPALIFDAQKNPALSDGTVVFVTGWGATAPTLGGPVLRAVDGKPLRASAQLKIVELKVMPNSRCDAVDTYHGTMSVLVLCAGSGKEAEDACTWDSGGPLVRKSDLVLVGLVSRGKGCGLKDIPSVYTNVARYRTWIQRAKAAPNGRVTAQ